MWEVAAQLHVLRPVSMEWQCAGAAVNRDQGLGLGIERAVAMRRRDGDAAQHHPALQPHPDAQLPAHHSRQAHGRAGAPGALWA